MIVKIVSTTVGQYEVEYNVVKAFYSQDSEIAEIAAQEFIDEQQKKTKKIETIVEMMHKKGEEWRASHPEPTKKRKNIEKEDSKAFGEKQSKYYLDFYEYKKSVAEQLMKEHEDLNLKIDDIMFHSSEYVYYEIEDLEVVELD